MILKQIYLTHTWDPYMKVLVRVDLAVIKMKKYTSLPRPPKLEPHHQMQFNVIPRTPTFFDCVLLLHRGYSQRILCRQGACLNMNMFNKSQVYFCNLSGFNILNNALLQVFDDKSLLRDRFAMCKNIKFNICLKRWISRNARTTCFSDLS